MTKHTGSEVASASGDVPARLDQTMRIVLAVLLGSVFVVFLSETILGVAIPDIVADLQITPAIGPWLTTAFALTTAVVIPLTGWLLQRVRTRPVFIAAMTTFTLGTAIARLRDRLRDAFIGRTIQGGGTAIMMPLMMTTILTIVPAAHSGRIMARNSIVISLASALGPTVSGLILTRLGWHWIFLLVLLPSGASSPSSPATHPSP